MSATECLIVDLFGKVRGRLQALPVVLIRRCELLRRERNAFDLGRDFESFHGSRSWEARS